MSLLNIKIIEGEVKEIWDTPLPENEEGWRQAIEVYPSIVKNRQYYTGKVIDTTKDPVEIVYGLADLTVEGRKNDLMELYKIAFQEIVDKEIRKEVDEFPETKYDAAVVDAARMDFEAKMTALAAISTHEELDLLWD